MKAAFASVVSLVVMLLVILLSADDWGQWSTVAVVGTAALSIAFALIALGGALTSNQQSDGGWRPTIVLIALVVLGGFALAYLGDSDRARPLARIAGRPASRGTSGGCARGSCSENGHCVCRFAASGNRYKPGRSRVQPFPSDRVGRFLGGGLVFSWRRRVELGHPDPNSRPRAARGCARSRRSRCAARARVE